MMDLMRELHAEGRTIVMITHDMNIVAEYAERMVVMAGGVIVADGAPREVFGRDDALASADLRAPQAFRIARQRPNVFREQPLTVEEARLQVLATQAPSVPETAS